MRRQRIALLISGWRGMTAGAKNAAGIDYQTVFDEAIVDFLMVYGVPAVVLTGGARGADALAEAWAKRNDIPLDVRKAAWKTLGPAAGPLRNTDLVQACTHVLAFPHASKGRGTQDAVQKATAAGRHVMVTELDSQITLNLDYPCKHIAQMSARQTCITCQLATATLRERANHARVYCTRECYYIGLPNSVIASAKCQWCNQKNAHGKCPIGAYASFIAGKDDPSYMNDADLSTPIVVWEENKVVHFAINRMHRLTVPSSGLRHTEMQGAIRQAIDIVKAKSPLVLSEHQAYGIVLARHGQNTGLLLGELNDQISFIDKESTEQVMRISKYRLKADTVVLHIYSELEDTAALQFLTQCSKITESDLSCVIFATVPPKFTYATHSLLGKEVVHTSTIVVKDNALFRLLPDPDE